MNPLDQSLMLIDKAERLQEQIVDALKAGNSETAETLCQEHQRVITEIPFAELPTEIPQELSQALLRLQRGNDKLTAVTENIQREIGEQLNQVQRGISGSQVYRDIDRHQ